MIAQTDDSALWNYPCDSVALGFIKNPEEKEGEYHGEGCTWILSSWANIILSWSTLVSDQFSKE